MANKMSLTESTKRLLLSRSAGFCANPSCHGDLFPFFKNGTVTNIEELAHIISQSKKGPRGNNSLPLSERDTFENIIILCPNCHTKIDKNPSIFPEEDLIRWKKEHQESIVNLFHIKKYSSRKELKSEIDKLLLENKSIFDTYGPHSEYAKDILSSAYKTWIQKSIDNIIPNNRKIVVILTMNDKLLNQKDRELLEAFKLHKDGFEYNKLSGDKVADYPLFPEQFFTILE